MKVLFLDIDGVLNTEVSAVMYGSLYPGAENVASKLDHYGLRLMNFLISKGVKIVLSSTWRLGQTKETSTSILGFEIYDHTHTHSLKGSTRGYEIQDWLDNREDISHYCILDDDSDMLPEQIPSFVHVRDPGLTFLNIVKICEVLDIDPMEIKKFNS